MADIDISDLPVPPSGAGDVDISDLPVPPKDDSGLAHLKKVAKIATDHPFTAMAGLAENALSGAAGGVADLANVVTGHEPDAPDRYVPAKWTQPHTEAGQQIAEATGEETANLGKQYDKIPGADTPLGQTIKRYGPEAFGAISTVVPLIKGVGAVAGRFGSGAAEAGRGGTPSAPPPTEPTPPPEGPITGESLRAQPDPLAPAPPAPEPAAPASTPPEASAAPGAPPDFWAPGVRAAEPVTEPASAPESTSAAPQGGSTAEPAPSAPSRPVERAAPAAGTPEPPRFTPPSADGTITRALPAEQQAARQATLSRLNDLAGGQLGEVRASALTGDYAETGQDWTHAKAQEESGARMRDVIGNESNTLRTAADNLVERTGTVTDGVDNPALERRGTVISKAISGIEDWFDNNVRSMYDTAKTRARGIPIQDMASLKNLAGDESNFAGTTEGEALYRGVQARARKLGLIGADGAFKPATVEQAEQFRQYLGEQWTPRTAGLINRLKDAVDEDVARHGGSDLFTQARALRSQKGRMLEDPTGIAKLLHPDDRLGINRAVPLDKVPDYVADLDPEQFHHVVNVLKSAAHLGDGELAEPAAAAIREIKGHMAARLNDAGASKVAGSWDAKSLYKKLNDYSLKMPSVFSPDEMGDWKTINDASNILKMDKTYKGAVIEAHNAGFGARVREKAGTLARGAIDTGAHGLLGPFGAPIAELSGISEKVSKWVGGDPEKAIAAKRLQTVEGRISKLQPELGSQSSKVRPTSQTGGPGSPILPPKQRGAVGVLNKDRGLLNAKDAREYKHYWELRGHSVTLESNGRGLFRVSDKNLNTAKSEATVNIGLNVGDKQGLTPEQVSKVLKSQGVSVKRSTVHQSNTEPTMVATLDKPLTPKQATTVSALLKQDAIAQVAGGKGALYGPKAADWGPFSRDHFLTHEGETLSANDPLFFKHYSDLTGKSIELDPSFYGKGLKGAERMRIAGGAPKVVSAYAPEGEVEKELQGKTQYQIKVPKKDMYDLSADPKGFKQAVMDENSGVYDHSEVERKIKEAGYTGYHLPDGQGIFKGQARFFNKVPATRAPEEPIGARAFGGRQRGAVGILNKKPGLPTEHLTDEERGQLRADTTQRVIDAFHKDLPPTEEYAAAALAGKAKKGWYENSARAITNMFGPDSPRFAALLAAMSPQTSVQMNFHNALRTFVNWDKSGRPTSPAAIKSIMEESSLKSDKSNEGGSNVLHAWVPNAIRALTHPDPDTLALSGPKVNSFMHNLRDNVNEVTNDAWMTSFAKVDPSFVKGREQSAKNPAGKSPGYIAMSAKVRAAAKMLTHMTGESWTPREVQETVWSWAKTASEHADSYQGLATIPELVKDKEITDELIKSTPDFHQLFSAPEHSAVIGSSRFAENAERMGGEPSGPSVQGGTGEKTAATERALQAHLQTAAKRLEQSRQLKHSQAGAQ